MPRVKIDPDKQRYQKEDRRKYNAGWKRWEPEEWHRTMALKMAGIGLPQKYIAKILEIDLLTLRKYLQHELDLGIAQVHAIVLNKAFEKIQQGDNYILAMYLKAKLGWNEPRGPVVDDDEELDGMTSEQLEAEIAALATRQGVAAKARGLEAPVSE